MICLENTVGGEVVNVFSLSFPWFARPNQKAATPQRGQLREGDEGDSNAALLMVLLMEEIRLTNQLRLVGFFPMIYDGFYTSQVVQDFFHQQYFHKLLEFHFETQNCRSCLGGNYCVVWCGVYFLGGTWHMCQFQVPSCHFGLDWFNVPSRVIAQPEKRPRPRSEEAREEEPAAVDLQ